MNALILAGGENKRIPLIKGFIDIKGKRIIDANLEVLRDIFDRIILSTNNPELYFYLGVPMIGDIYKYKGPMTGILSSLVSLGEEEIFVTACDMPFIKPELIRYIVDMWTKNRGWDAAIPVFNGKSQPLIGIYSRKIIKTMEDSIKTSKRSLRDFLKKRNVLYISEEEVRRIDPFGRSFVNINTMEDYKEALKI
ncbi:MAG: molybdenum cofactor guanylyltransferase [Nitrospirae bacterium]|nr:molybdenum cofactor guanylyltransferase [Nitrospirota bacterium]